LKDAEDGADSLIWLIALLMIALAMSVLIEVGWHAWSYSVAMVGGALIIISFAIMGPWPHLSNILYGVGGVIAILAASLQGSMGWYSLVLALALLLVYKLRSL